MEFEELLLEEILTIVKESKDENLMKYDLKRLLNQRLQEYGDTIEESCYGYSDEEYDKAVAEAYADGYDEGYNEAREDMEGFVIDMRKRK